MKLFTFRYMWRVEGDNHLQFKMVTDTASGLEQFEKSLLELPGLTLAGREYLNEFDVSRIAVLEKFYCKEDTTNE